MLLARACGSDLLKTYDCSCSGLPTTADAIARLIYAVAYSGCRSMALEYAPIAALKSRAANGRLPSATWRSAASLVLAFRLALASAVLVCGRLPRRAWSCYRWQAALVDIDATDESPTADPYS